MQSCRVTASAEDRSGGSFWGLWRLGLRVHGLGLVSDLRGVMGLQGCEVYSLGFRVYQTQ